MIRSEIKTVNGAPRLFLDGAETPAVAYTTYFEERSRYEDFADAGYRLFLVNVSMTALPINSCTGFTPFRAGVFDDKGAEDWSEFEGAVHRILSYCPDAVIIPRIYLSMPAWWVGAHPDDVVMTPRGGFREVIFSDIFRRDCKELLISMIRHIAGSDYGDRVGGWMFCGGNTQEWFHHGHTGSISPCAERYFKKWMKENYGAENAPLPSFGDYAYTDKGFNEDENARRYAEFANVAVADTVAYFARVIKEETGRSQIVGTFYGYSLVASLEAAVGSFALRRVIDSDDLDFFSSPNSYSKNREFGIDWSDMIPVESVKLRGKLAFIECDIRTFLTVSVQEARPGRYPEDIYSTAKPGKPSVWSGPPTAKLSAEALRKCFAHQITHGSAIWWFDMFGGWYADPLLMNELISMKKIYGGAGGVSPRREVAVFSDEAGYANLFDRSPQKAGIGKTILALGVTGVPYDCYLAEDAERVLKNYKAAVFLQPYPSDTAKRAMRLCGELGVAVIGASPERNGLTADGLRAFFKENGVHVYADGGDAVFLGNGYIGLHSVNGGKKTLSLPEPFAVTPIYGADMPKVKTDKPEFTLADCATALFKLE